MCRLSSWLSFAHQVREHLASHMLDILDPSKFNAFRGDLVPERLLKISEERRVREEERRQKRAEYERMMEAQRKKVRGVFERLDRISKLSFWGFR